MSKSKELFKNTLIIFLGKVSTQFLSFFLLPLYTAYLDSGDYGTIDLILTYLTLIVPVFTLEIEMGAFRFLVDNRNNEKEKNDIICNSTILLLKFMSLFLVLYVLILVFFKFKYCYLAGICLVSMMLSNLLMQIARGLGKNIEYSISCFLSGSINIIVNIVLIIVMKKTAGSILVATFISNIACSTYLLLKLKIIKSIKIGMINKDIQRNLIKFSWPLVPNTISWWLINASDRTIVTLLIGVSANGIYAISTKFSSIISSFLNIFNLSWTESASLHIDDDDRNEFFSHINDTILCLFSGICIVLIAFMPILFNLFIDNSYIEAYKYIPINIVASFFSCVVSIYSAIYVAKKMTKQVASTSFFAAIINLVVDLILIKYIGLFAASLSTAIAYIVMSIYRGYDLKKYVKIKYNVKHLVIIFLGFCVSIFLYYQQGFVFNVLNYIFSIVYMTILNLDFIKKTVNKFFKRNNRVVQ